MGICKSRRIRIHCEQCGHGFRHLGRLTVHISKYHPTPSDKKGKRKATEIDEEDREEVGSEAEEIGSETEEIESETEEDNAARVPREGRSHFMRPIQITNHATIRISSGGDEAEEHDLSQFLLVCPNLFHTSSFYSLSLSTNKLLQNGFNETLEEAIQASNNAFQQFHSGAKSNVNVNIHKKRFDPERKIYTFAPNTCLGPGNGKPCKFTEHGLSERNATLLIKDGKLAILPRCLLCTTAQGMSKDRHMLAKFTQGICIVKGCENPTQAGSLNCEECKHNNVTAGSSQYPLNTLLKVLTYM